MPTTGTVCSSASQFYYETKYYPPTKRVTSSILCVMLDSAYELCNEYECHYFDGFCFNTKTSEKWQIPMNSLLVTSKKHNTVTINDPSNFIISIVLNKTHGEKHELLLVIV